MESFINACLFPDEKIMDDRIISAFQECLQNYESCDFENKMLKGIKIGHNDTAEEILGKLSPYIPTTKQMLERQTIIENNQFPISFYKQSSGRNMIAIWDSIVHSSGSHIWCFDEQYTTDVVCIDISSLLTLDYLGLLDTLNNIFDEINIPQSVFNELRNVSVELPRKGQNEEGTLVKDSDDHLRFVQTCYPYEKWSSIAKRIVGFIKSSSKVNIVGKPLKAKNIMPEDFKKLYNKSLFTFDLDVLTWAYSVGCPIMFENQIFRHCYNSFSNSPQSFCVIDYLVFMENNNFITYKTYILDILKLCKSNYMLVPIHFNIIIFSLEYYGYIIGIDNEYIFNTLFSDYYNLAFSSANTIVALLIIWCKCIPTEVKIYVTNYFLNRMKNKDLFKIYSLESIKTFINTYMINRVEAKNFVNYMEDYIGRFKNV
jgi:hypothetical protein